MSFRLPVLLVVAAVAGCASRGPALVQPGAPGQPTRGISAAAAADTSGVRYTDADVRFMQGMIAHHSQALEMTALVPSRTRSDDITKLALRIELSQRDEIALMTSWLRARGQEVPSPRAMEGHAMPGHEGMAGMAMDGAVLMPGMLTPEEMAALAAASGPAFDTLFLEGMIRHHGGALTMVRNLFATPGAGQEPEIFAFTADVEADQRMEIDRMQALLDRQRQQR